MQKKCPSVVVADSHVASGFTLQQQLADAGIPVSVASTGEDVLILCDIAPPSVLIIDGHFPDMDAYELCERVRHEAGDFDVTIIIMTDVCDDMTRTYLSQMVDFAGGDFFVAKPYDVHWLVCLLDTILRDKRRKEPRLSKWSPKRRAVRVGQASR